MNGVRPFFVDCCILICDMCESIYSMQITDRDMPFNDDPIMRGLLLGLSLTNNNAESQALRSYMKQMRRAGLYLMDSGMLFYTFINIVVVCYDYIIS